MNGRGLSAIYQSECDMLGGQIKTAPELGATNTGPGGLAPPLRPIDEGGTGSMLPSYRTPGEDTPADVPTLSIIRPLGGVL